MFRKNPPRPPSEEEKQEWEKIFTEEAEMHDYLFEVYHYCVPRDSAEGRKSSNGFFPTMDEAEQQYVRLSRYAQLRGLDIRYYIQQFDMDNVAEFFREHPI